MDRWEIGGKSDYLERQRKCIKPKISVNEFIVAATEVSVLQQNTETIIIKKTPTTHDFFLGMAALLENNMALCLWSTRGKGYKVLLGKKTNQNK